jgi:branched-chain amino acid transport system permease protein
MPLASRAVALARQYPIGIVAIVAAAVVVWVLPSLLDPYWLFLTTTAVIMAFVAMSIGVVTGRAGMMSLCQLSFGAVGAWVIAYLQLHGWSLPTPLMVIIAGLAAVPIGVVLALPALRVRGINLAIITLGFASFADIWFSRHDLPGTDEAAFIVRSAAFADDKPFFYMTCAMLAGAMILLWLVGRRPIGGSWLGLRYSERSLAALGVSVPWTKITCFGASAFLAGVAGALLVVQNGTITVDTFVTVQSLVAFAVAIMVGARYPEGAVLAGVFGIFVPEILRRIGVSEDVGNIFFGIGMIGALAGGAGMAEGWRNGLRRRRVARQDAAAPTSQTVDARVQATRPAEPPVAISRSGSGTAALSLRGVTVRYGSVVALDSVDLTVDSGTVHALIGPNGAGKSTLVDTVTGFISGYEGEITLEGRRVDAMSATRRARSGLRRTFQQGLAIPALTVQRYIELSAHRSLRRGEVAELMAFLDGPRPDRMIADVDVGSRRIVEVAAGLAARPKVLLLDEPGAGLATEESLNLALRLIEVPSRFGCSVLLIDHDMELVKASCSAITVLDFGKVIAAGDAAEVLEHTAVIDAYLGAEEATLADA